MLRRLTIFAVMGLTALAAGCGGGGSSRSAKGFPRKFSTGGRLMYGMRAYLQSDKDVYIEGETIKLMCALQNKSPRTLYLDSTGNWGLAKVVVREIGGDVVETEEKRARVRRDYLKLEPGKAVRWRIDNLGSPLWKVKTPLKAGKYKLTLVYDATSARESEQWDRLSAAGGPFEGGELWAVKAESNPVMITVKSLEEALGKR